MVAHGRTIISDPQSKGVVVKATFNGTSGVAKVFIGSQLDGSSSSSSTSTSLPTSFLQSTVASELTMSFGAGIDTDSGTAHSFFLGAFEEVKASFCPAID